MEWVEKYSRQVSSKGRLPFCKKMGYNTIVGRKYGRKVVHSSYIYVLKIKYLTIREIYINVDGLLTKGR